jgi:prolyl-tRNA synthetase
MKQSRLFLKTRKETPADADSINASYLIRTGFVEKQMAGVYALLPLGFRVYKKIEAIIREEMNAVGGQEMLMNILQPKELWDETGRWAEGKEVMYQFKDSRDKEIGLGWTHEEQVTDIVRKKIKSYKDLPQALYQIHAKFRNEARAKSGLLRGREFMMKDMYSFHATEEDLDDFYEKVKIAYLKIYERLRLDAKVVQASGGLFSKYSHEFQVLAPVGEDVIYHCDKCGFAQNKEIAEVKEGDKCPECDGKIRVSNGIEVGNIFLLKNKYSKSMKALYVDQSGKQQEILMGCYGIGLTRAMATVVEIYYEANKNRMIWPEEIAPFKLHLISLGADKEAGTLYENLKNKDFELLYDDRDLSAGEKFAEADLIGCPKRIIVSTKTLNENKAEVIDVVSGKSEMIKLDQVIDEIT